MLDPYRVTLRCPAAADEATMQGIARDGLLTTMASDRVHPSTPAPEFAWTDDPDGLRTLTASWPATH